VLTVRELIAELDLTLLAGERGVDRPIRWVHMSELRDPTPWLSGGEVLLCTGMQLDDGAGQREFVSLLADRRLAGLGFGTGFDHAQVPPALVRAAAERDFPVFEIPYELPFIAVTEAAFSKLVNEQYAVLRRALAAQERLERVLLAERGLDALADTLANLLAACVLIYDGRGEIISEHTSRRTIGDGTRAAIDAGVRDRARAREAHPFMPSIDTPDRALALPVSIEGGAGIEAWLVAVKDDTALSDVDRLTLRQAVTIVALELLRARVADDTERRLGGDVLAALLSGELAGPELRRRLAPFGLGERAAALVIPGPEAQAAGRGELEGRLHGALRAEGEPALVASSEHLVCALVRGRDEEELFALAETVVQELALTQTGPPRLGVGRALPTGDLRRSYHEARCALEAMSFGLERGAGNGRGHTNVNGNGSDAHAGSRASMSAPRVATYRDLGSFQLLLSLQDDQALKLFCDSILGPIEQSEGYYGGELMRSLEAFIEENGQWERAAKRLYCHRHTLRYRIKRVEELTGRDLGSARDRIEFWLALRGRELV
jgi:purine catabolism regulator